MLLKDILKSMFKNNFRKYFQSFQYLNDKNFQVLKVLEIFPKIIIKRALIGDILKHSQIYSN